MTGAKAAAIQVDCDSPFAYRNRNGFRFLLSMESIILSVCRRLEINGICASALLDRARASSGLSRVHALPNRWPFPPLGNPQFIGRLKIEPKLRCRAQVTR